MLHFPHFGNLRQFPECVEIRNFENMSENESQAHHDQAKRGMILNWSNQRPINHPIFVKMSIENPHGN